MKKLQNSIPFLIIGLLLIVLYAVGSLSYNEFTHNNICPQLLGIPACYIILACVLLAFVGHLIKSNAVLFFFGASIPFAIAVLASIMELTGTVECPKTSLGIPMCFISLLLFSLIIWLKTVEINSRQPKQ